MNRAVHTNQDIIEEEPLRVWDFGLVDTSTSPAIGYMEIVDYRDQKTLLPTIKKVVRRRSSIHSNEW